MKQHKYAICIVGQFRTFHQENVYQNIYSSIKRIYNESDIFFIFGETPTKNVDMLINVFKPVTIAYYDTTNINPPINNSWGLLMAVGFKKAYDEILNKEKENGYKYEIIIKLRPDVILGSYFHEDLVIDTTKPSVYAEYLGGCHSPNITDCINDMSGLITRSAIESYFNFFYEDFYKDNTFTKIQCPECKLGWTLNNNNIYKGVINFRENIIRDNDNTILEPNTKIKITREPVLYSN